jgi:polyphosphate glucokinase
MTEQQRLAIGIDFGGSGIKAAAVDVESGELVSDRLRVPTPSPSEPAAVTEAMARLVKRVERQVARSGLPVGVGIPAVVIEGVVTSAANIDAGWIDYHAQAHLERLMKRSVVTVNDADAAGIAEMRFGAGRDQPGTVIVLTLGTGTGSAIFVDGSLVPNTELGHMEIRGRHAEHRSAAAARVRRGLSWKAWASDLDEHLQRIELLFSPRLFILGGGVSKNADRFIPRLTVRADVVPAVLRNNAGIIGAALVAYARAEAAGLIDPPVEEPAALEAGDPRDGAMPGGDAEPVDGRLDPAVDAGLDAAVDGRLDPAHDGPADVEPSPAAEAARPPAADG